MTPTPTGRTTRRTILAALIAMIALTAHAVPASISYQAYLTDSQGAAVTGTVQIGLRLFSAGGALLYEEAHADVEVSAGLFELAIGTGAPVSGVFTASLFAGADPADEMELEIDGETLLPRRPFESAAYAQNAQDSELLGGSPASSFLSLEATGTQTVAGGVLVIDGIAGDVQTSGDYRFETPRTYLHVVSPDRFVPQVSDVGDWALGNQSGMYRYALTTTTVRSYAGLNLPVGAIPRRLYCHYYDPNIVGTIAFLFARLQYRLPGTPGTIASYGVVNTDSVFPTTSTEVRTSSVPLTTAAVPAGVPLLIDLQWRVDNVTSSLRFYGCDVEYTLDRVSSP